MCSDEFLLQHALPPPSLLIITIVAITAVSLIHIRANKALIFSTSYRARAATLSDGAARPVARKMSPEKLALNRSMASPALHIDLKTENLRKK